MATSLISVAAPTFSPLASDPWLMRGTKLPVSTGTGTVIITETPEKGDSTLTDLDLSTVEYGSWSKILILERALSLLASVAGATTISPLNDLTATFRAYVPASESLKGFETGYRLDLRVEEWPWTAPVVARRTTSEQPESEATRLRRLSGLDIDELAAIFGISRPAYYAWMAGKPPRTSRHEHLLEVLTLLEEAASRLESPAATKTWLRTPITPAGPTPLGLLRERDYDVFRGSLLRTQTGRESVRLLQQSERRRRTVAQEELEDGLRRLRGPAWLDDPDTDEPVR